MLTDKQHDRLIAVFTAVVSILVAISVLTTDIAADESLIYLADSYNNWSLYQAKAIRSMISESDMKMLQIELKNPNNSEQTNVELQAKINELQERINRYASEKEELSKEAEKFTVLSGYKKSAFQIMGKADFLFELCLLTTCIIIFTNKRKLWYVNFVFLIIGIIAASRGIMHFIH